ncbi:MAG TPA: carboxypeptidase-like regulatory domain-containing protein, partial [Candidatus Micrarchaeota archaeon]|nr:carboxypeptidase-like regulatory domain-containing protein [Candidatus Micrarchaeota archaeon]
MAKLNNPRLSHLPAFILALLSLSIALHAQYQINVNITPTNYFSIQPNMTSLDFGDITSGKSQVFYIQNDGNTISNITLSSSEGSRVKMFVTSTSDKEDGGGPACEGTISAYATGEPIPICTNLRYIDSADRIAVAIRLEPLPTSIAGHYESDLLLVSQSSAGTRQMRLPITYSISPLPAIIQTGSAKIATGSVVSAKITDVQGNPLPNSKLTVQSPDGSVKSIVSDSRGIAVFETTSAGTYLMNVTGRNAAGSVVALPASQLASESPARPAGGAQQPSAGFQSLVSDSISNAAGVSAALANSAIGVPIALLVICVFAA